MPLVRPKNSERYVFSLREITLSREPEGERVFARQNPPLPSVPIMYPMDMIFSLSRHFAVLPSFLLKLLLE